ncbi:hypothetical protein L1987_77895 [Smallanthus sonchifolius]|uniref:Uncharacterized protein n=1 Tax=Smallanthus sonchifolius TaxID=185202 RepID=A0ACB8ZA94_9ASTR|nr:hypothetical protein L1987_77895 [Smallanthus sonchifolius]
MPFFAMILLNMLESSAGTVAVVLQLLGKEFAVKKVVKVKAIGLVLLKYNAALSPAVLSRSDVVYVMINYPDDTTDYHIASHIVRVHQKHIVTSPTFKLHNCGVTLLLLCLKSQRVAYRMTVKTAGGTNQLPEEMAT